MDKLAARALILFSGGLDSMLALMLLREQGCYVEGVVFDSPFFKIEQARTAAKELALKLHVVDVTDEIMALVRSPPHGFGAALNPCIDCHAMMVRRAAAMVEQWGWDCVASGEVLNQRPMSQNRRALELVAAAAGCEGRLLRPLSALRLGPTVAEQDGRIDRTRLLGIDGRSRRPQKELAKRFGITAYPAPAGGCLLTEKLFCHKLKDVIAYNEWQSRRALDWLKLGRHFRLPGGGKCVMGRDERENQRLLDELLPGDLLLHPLEVPGPTVVLLAGGDENDRALAAALCSAYCDGDAAQIRLHKLEDGAPAEALVARMARTEAKKWMV